MSSNLIIISGPSGSGQDSVIKGLEKFFSIERVITFTTRAMRPGEAEGKPYYFISKDEFKKKIKNKEFFEYAKQYNGNFYGVANAEITRVRDSGKPGIWKIDYQGVINVKKKMPDIPAILIIAPLDVLEERIKKRDAATDKYIKDRMNYTKKWLKHTDIYDYIVENKDGHLDETVRQVKKVITKIKDAISHKDNNQ